MELLRNGSFDVGPISAWPTTPLGAIILRRADDPNLISAHQVAPHSGSTMARLGGPVRFEYSRIDQYVTIPRDALEITISGFIQIRTEEDFENDYDLGSVALSGDFGTIKAQGWSNLDVIGTWTQFSFTANVELYRGVETRFAVAAELSETVATYFFFDTLSLKVTACSP